MRYLFEDCALDTDRRELRRGPALVAVAPQVFDLLVHLIRHRDRVVSKDDLLASVWHGRIVSEFALFNRINAARSAIGDTGDQQRLIKTLPRKGIRFVGEVREDEASAAAHHSRDRQRIAPERSTRRHTAEDLPLPLPDRPSIAVLPFANMSGDPDQEYFADGISEDLITGLSRIRWLFVIARNSTFVYKHRAVDVKQVSRELGVRYVLEGSVRRAGKRLRISAQLIDAMTGGHHWAERYDRELGDIFAVQDEITRSVAAAIEPHLLAAEGVRALSRSSDDLGAWELVARAQTHAWRLTRPDYETAIDALKRAVEAYPDYAPARSLLGFCLVFAAHMGWIDRDQGLLPGRQHAIRAIALDDRDPWGHIALGYWRHDGKAHRGVDRGVSPGGQAQSEFRGGPLSSQPRLGFCGAGSRSDRARGRCHQAQSLGSGHGAVPRRLSRLLTTRPGDMQKLPTTRRKPCGCARVFRARNVCAARAWPRRGGSTKPGRFWQRCDASSRSYRSTG